jgi:3-deoxy-manno-octulosonate cytidylyltransferase (CMP-KDO synthetase)
MTKTAIVIPARYDSTRFPGKPLTKLGNKTMIERVYEKCKATGLDTFVLTDDTRIGRIFGWDVCWIDQANVRNGTERIANAIGNDFFSAYNKFINVQGDMPDVTSEMIEKCEWHLKHYPVTTVCTQMQDERLNDPNSVKIVRAADKVLWCGRGMSGYGDWHLGVYGYRRNALEFYNNLIITREEEIEQLEQLRWLKNGWDIGILPVKYNGVEINTPEDAAEWNKRNSLVHYTRGTRMDDNYYFFDPDKS